jgi:hypothetical protein
MPDYRTKRQKLEAMADQVVSPNEAEVAKRKLAEETLRMRGFSEEEVAKAFDNHYGDVIVIRSPVGSGWVPVWTSNHFSDDELVGRKTSPKNLP